MTPSNMKTVASCSAVSALRRMGGNLVLIAELKIQSISKIKEVRFKLLADISQTYYKLKEF